MTSNVEHTDVGAYALGLLEESDRRAFEAHLPTCPACQAELREFGEMAQLLGEVKQNPPSEEHSERRGRHAGPPDPTGSGAPADPRSAPVVDLLRRKATADRSRRRGRTVLAIAAGVVLLAGGGAIGVVLGGDEPAGQHNIAGPGPAEQLLMTGARISGTDPKTKAAGVIAVESKGWGTHVALQLENVRGPLECELVAVSKSGAKRVVTGWAVPPKGWGVPGAPDPGMVHGGTSFKRDQIARFDVMILGGKRDGERLLSIPAA